MSVLSASRMARWLLCILVLLNSGHGVFASAVNDGSKSTPTSVSAALNLGARNPTIVGRNFIDKSPRTVNHFPEVTHKPHIHVTGRHVPKVTHTPGHPAVQVCNHDNCLRAMLQHAATASAVCPRYTASVLHNEVPEFSYPECDSPAAASSACSCAVTPTHKQTSTPTATPTPHCNHDNCLRNMLRQSAVASAVCPRYTETVLHNEVPEFSYPDCDSAAAASSACSCVVPPKKTSSSTKKTTSSTRTSSHVSTTSTTKKPTSSTKPSSVQSTTKKPTSSSTHSSVHSTLTTKPPTSTTHSSVPPAVTTPPVCNGDNCLNELRDHRFSASASQFCQTYTTTINTNPAAIPTYLENCQLSPSQVSSACTCLMYTTTTSSSKSTSTTSSAQSTSTTSSAQSTSTTSQTTSSSQSTTTTKTTSSTASSTPTPNPPPNCDYSGCFGSTSSFPNFDLIESTGSMSIELCASECATSGQPYAGLHKADCYCASSIVSSAEAEIYGGHCTASCPGDRSEACGGPTIHGPHIIGQPSAETMVFDIYSCTVSTTSSSTTSSSTQTSSMSSSTSASPSDDASPKRQRDTEGSNMEPANPYASRDYGKMKRGGILRGVENKQPGNVLVKRDFGIEDPGWL